MLKKYVYDFGMFGVKLTVSVGGIGFKHTVEEFFITNFGVTPDAVKIDDTGVMTVKANGFVNTFTGQEVIEDDWYIGGYFGSRKNTKKPHMGDTGGFRSH